MGKLRRRQRTYKNRSRSAKHPKKIINMKGCSNRNCGQTGGCCGVMSGGSKKRRQVGGAFSAWNPTSGGEFYTNNSYNVQPDRMLEATRTTLESTPVNVAFGGGGRSKRKGRPRLKFRRTNKNENLQKGVTHPQQKGGSIIQEFWNGTGLINDMVSTAYRGYNGLDPLPSSSVYRGQFARVV
jgi:hypothetical protein